MFPFAAVKLLREFIADRSSHTFKEVWTAVTQIGSFVSDTIDTFTLKEAKVTVGGDYSQALSEWCKDNEGFGAEPTKMFPIWLLVALPQLIKVVTDLLAKISTQPS